MTGKPKDNAPWLLTACLVPALSGASVLLPRTPAQAQTSHTSMAGVTAHADDGDGDGDELLEHWGDPKYSQEQRAQFGGLLAFFAGCGVLSYRRRSALRRFSRNG